MPITFRDASGFLGHIDGTLDVTAQLNALFTPAAARAGTIAALTTVDAVLAGQFQQQAGRTGSISALATTSANLAGAVGPTVNRTGSIAGTLSTIAAIGGRRYASSIVSAVVTKYDAQGNQIGFGPSDDPDGVFYGRTDLVNGDIWSVRTMPTGCTITPLPGGSYTIAVGAGVATGGYSFDWIQDYAAGGSVFGTQSFVVGTSFMYVDAANPAAGNGTAGNPYKTIQAAASVATAGTIVSVASGTYAEMVTISTSGILLVAASARAGFYPAIVTGSSARNNAFRINSASGVLIDGFKVTMAVVQGVYVLGPSITSVEVRNCWTYETGSSGIACWGVQYGTDPVPSNWRGIQQLNVHHNRVERACNTFLFPTQGFNECITIANGVFNTPGVGGVHHNTVIGPVAADYTVNNGGEGIDIKEGVEGLDVFCNTVSTRKNAIYLDAGRSASIAGGYTRPGFVKSIHCFNNLIHNTTGHGITVTSEADIALSATAANGRTGGQINDITVDYNTVFGCSGSGILLYDYALLSNGFTTSTVPLADNVRVVNNATHGNNTSANSGYSGLRYAHGWMTNALYNKNVSTGNGSGMMIGIGSNTPAVTNTINADPLFTNSAALDFTLQTGSPAKNVGGNALVNPTTDHNDNPRPFGTTNDVGAFERQAA